MRNLKEIHRPKSIAEAIAELQRPGAFALAGGTALLEDRRADVRTAVDLSGLGLAYIRDKAGAVAIGAMTSLAEIADSPILRALARGMVARAAHRSAASLLRNQATLAGTLISEPAGVLAASLLALDAQVGFASGDPAASRAISLEELLARRPMLPPGEIMVEVILPPAAIQRKAGLATVSRTPRDKPIVAVCAAVQLEDGMVRSAALAMGGVSEVAVRAHAAEQLVPGKTPSDELIADIGRTAAQGVNPVGDFRGTFEYRREMVRVLVSRALREALAAGT